MEPIDERPPAEEQPVQETPAQEEPVAEEPAKEEPVKEEPTQEVVAKELPVSSEPINEGHVIQEWDHVKGATSHPFLIASLVCLLFVAGAVVLCIISEFSTDFDRFDKFNPQRVALTSRHWDDYNRQFEPIPDLTGRDADGFPVVLNETQRYEGCIRTTVAGKAVPPYTAQYDCEYHVAYAAAWAAMACGFLGLSAVCFYANRVVSQPRGTEEMSRLAEIIHESALTFLHQEYTWLLPFVCLLWVFIFVAVDGQQNDWVPATSASFLLGAFLSASCGYFGMHIATEGNCRTAAACYSDKDKGLSNGLTVAFQTGACMGLGVVSFGIVGLTTAYVTFGNTNALGGFSFGASAVALFARVGGGIYTKAADVGADLCGKVDNSLAEDSPKNPATIADCVGDNVGDVAGMGADLFESFVGAIVAACVMGAPEFGKKGVALPFYIVSIGLVWSILCTMYIRVGKRADGTMPTLDDLLKAIRLNIFVAGGLITVTTLFLCVFFFETEAEYLDDVVGSVPKSQLNPGPRLFGCIMLGLIVGILIGMVTEYFTSHTDEPTQSIGRSTEFGPGPVIIQGLGMGMYSTVVPLLLIVTAILGSYYLCGFYGTAITVCGMLSTLGVTMSTDAYGPVADNAGGIAEMSELPPWVRDYTDSLDALGNTTAATGKGFANGSAVLSALSLMAAFARTAGIEKVNLLEPVVVIGILVGALLPYVFGAMTMLSVNKAAQEMMHEVRRQFRENPEILTDPNSKPDYASCIKISCTSSLREMLMPGVLAIFAPLIMGFGFGSHCLIGVLIGAIASGYLLGVQMSNTGGAWDNAKKWIEAGGFEINGVVQGKGTDCHKAAVCGDTVGDPFKDTSGPALNILIKVMASFAFVTAKLFDDSWEFWWIGAILLAVACILVAIIQFVVLAKPVVAEDEVLPEQKIETA